jgi:hypothetical protein
MPGFIPGVSPSNVDGAVHLKLITALFYFSPLKKIHYSPGSITGQDVSTELPHLLYYLSYGSIFGPFIEIIKSWL